MDTDYCQQLLDLINDTLDVLCCYQGDLADAESYLAQAYSIWQKTPGEAHSNTSTVRQNLEIIRQQRRNAL